MIRFNGFPFLEKDDHAYNVPGTYSSTVYMYIVLTCRQSLE